MSEYEGIRLQVRALQSELVELMDKLVTRVDTNADRDDSLFRAWRGLCNLRDAIYDLGKGSLLNSITCLGLQLCSSLKDKREARA